MNRPPMVLAVEVEPEVVPRGGTARLRVRAEDPDGDRLTFVYRAVAGRIEADAASPAEASYQAAPAGPIADRVTVVVTDARGLGTTFVRAVTVAGPEIPAATARPSPVPEAPEATATVAMAPPAQTLPSTRTPSPRPPPASTPGPRNRPPLLRGGTTVHGLTDTVTSLTAEGEDPDGDSVTHRWDWGDCAIAEAFDRALADVRLKDGCDNATVVLTWTDRHGASASTEWYLYR